MQLTAEERFWCKVDQNGPIPVYNPSLGPCWLWTAAVSKNGYGNFYAGKDAENKWPGAHKFSYELEFGPVPKGLEVEHLCRVRLCVRPSHFEAVTTKENLRRIPNSPATRTHCLAGHEYNAANTYFCVSSNQRGCRECGAIAKRKKRGVTTVKVYNTQRRMSQV